MNSSMNRRDFAKRAGAAAAGFAIASEAARRAYAQNEKVRVACIGTGGQGTFHIQTGLAGAEAVQIVAVCDVYAQHQADAQKMAQASNAKIALTPGKQLNDDEKAAASAALKPNAYYDHKEMLSKEEIDAVVIATPPMTHFPITMDCLNAGKRVFCEKALVHSVEEGRQLIQYCHDHNTWVQVGHQRRYNPKYNLGMWLAYEQGMLGRINHITAQWHRNHYWRRIVDPAYVMNDQEKRFITNLEHHLNWRIYAETSGGLFFELATHQTDVANWFLKAVPKRVYAIGGTDYWRDGRTTDDNILMAYEYELKPSSPGFTVIDARSKTQDINQINKSYAVRMSYTSILANAKSSVSELIQGDKGALEMTEDKCFFHMEPTAIKPKDPTKITSDCSPPELCGGGPLEGVGLLADRPLKAPDVYQFEAFAECIRNGGMPRSHQVVGVAAAITGIAALESRRTGLPVDLDPAWLAFDFETPSFYDYDPSWAEKPTA